MLLTNPHVLGIDDSPQRSQLRQIAVVADTQLRPLSVTENYLLETYELPFGVITSA
jgi:hypothetical protein